MRAALVSLVLALSFSFPAVAQKEAPISSLKAQEASAKGKEGTAANVEARAVSTQHTIEIAGKNIPYTATAGTIILHNDKDEPTAKMFYIAFTKDHVSDPASRPATFAYNGGPGGA